MFKLKQSPMVIKTDIRSKFKNNFRSNRIIFFQIARSIGKKINTSAVSYNHGNMAIVFGFMVI